MIKRFIKVVLLLFALVFTPYYAGIFSVNILHPYNSPDNILDMWGWGGMLLLFSAAILFVLYMLTLYVIYGKRFKRKKVK